MDFFKKKKSPAESAPAGAARAAAPAPTAPATREGLQFIVMPEVTADQRRPERRPTQTKPQPVVPPPPPVMPGKPVALSLAAGKPGGSRLMKALLIVLVISLILGLGYVAYVKFYSPKVNSAKQPPKIYVDDVAKSDKDTDKDGLSDAREKQLGTNPALADTDGDSLADGDEVNVYQSDPLLPDTDSDGYDDGAEVARGYSPVVKSSDPAAALELQKWQERIAKFGLHEPTQTTLKLKAAAAPDQKPAIYTNAAFNYSFDVPPVLAYRESADRTQVGVYIAGSQDLGPDFDTDPIFVSTAVLAGSQSLKDFAAGQYGMKYQIKEVKIGTNSAVTAEGQLNSELCPKKATLFAEKSTVVILTQTCADLQAFVPFYQGIVQSFKFTK